jgi:hypothetical protein
MASGAFTVDATNIPSLSDQFVHKHSASAARADHVFARSPREISGLYLTV